MKYIYSLLLLMISFELFADFDLEAPKLAEDLKSSLLMNLSKEIQQNGVESAIPFCHTNVKSIAKESAKERIQKYEFGRTSHKIRNENNAPKDWMLPILEKFKGTSFDKDNQKNYKIHGTLPNGKKYYAEPLFVQAQCLSCHGEVVSKNVKDKINVFYPKDQATGFKLGEFRGLVWILEK